MANEKRKPEVPARTRVNVIEPSELLDWSRKFGVTPEQLKAAVNTVGPDIADLEKHFQAG